MLLPSLISLRRPLTHEPSPEDIFSSSLGSVFTDDAQNMHGDSDPETSIVYRPSNRKYNELEFKTADVNGEEERRKFAHYLWNAGILMAELIGGRPAEERREDKDSGVCMPTAEEWEAGRWKDGEWWISEAEERLWNMQDQTVLELGAGVGLGGIMSALSGAREVAITDYPAPPILSSITANVSKSIPSSLRARVYVHGHQWGLLNTPFAQENAGRYTRIMAADCLWMPHEHGNLARSMLHFLSPSPDARIFCIAGFHTGRAKLAEFFKVVPNVGLDVESIFEMDTSGKQRAWEAERDGGREDVGERKKWLVVARLRRKGA